MYLPVAMVLVLLLVWVLCKLCDCRIRNVFRRARGNSWLPLFSDTTNTPAVPVTVTITQDNPLWEDLQETNV